MATYEEVFPAGRKPPAVREGESREIFNDLKNHRAVSLDAGAFRAVWDLIESANRTHFPARGSISGYAAMGRAVEEFRLAYWGPVVDEDEIPFDDEDDFIPLEDEDEIPLEDEDEIPFDEEEEIPPPTPRRKTVRRKK